MKTYDYTHGWYFVTLCTEGRKHILGTVRTSEPCVGRGDLTPPLVALSSTGRVVETYLLGIADAYENVELDDYVIMPNHVHLIVSIEHGGGGGVRSPRPTSLLTVIRSFKRMVTRQLGVSIWQTSYYEHVIRNESDYLRIRQYMADNPAHWAEDEYYQES